MKTKLISLLWCCGLCYALPLVGQPHLLWTAQLGILILATALIISTQPPVRFSEAKANRHTDRYSTELLAACYAGCQVVSVVDWAYFQPDAHPFTLDWLTMVGLLLLTGGMAFRLWSIWLLGSYFTATVRTQAHQRIIRSGAYRLIRHPSYLGAYIVVVASAMLLHSFVGVVVSATVMLAAYHYRIRVEEATLVSLFGNEYSRYQRQSKKLIPFLY